ncbi:Putative lipoprotein OS=Streptomyces antimycoticus OX=68175 GN=SANT12839_012420 PE=4 SV=1 [Streptomyces antimycoticus]
MSTKPVAVRMTMRALGQGADAAVEIRLVDGAMYLDGGKEAAGELNGKSWLKLDLSVLGEKATGALGGGSLSRQADKNPADDSAFLSGADDVKRVGEETIDGVRTTHYRGTITVPQMRESLKDEDAATRERREKNLKEYEKTGGRPAVHGHVDRPGRPHQAVPHAWRGGQGPARHDHHLLRPQ